MEQVLYFQSDQVATNLSWATLNSTLTLLQGGTALGAIAICLRVLVPFFAKKHTPFTLSLKDNPLFLSLVVSKDGMTFFINGQGQHIPLLLVPGYWNNLCLQVDFKTSTLESYLKNESFIFSFDKSTAGNPQVTPATLVFGQSRDSGTTEFQAESSFRGQLTNFFLWTRLLTTEEIESFNICQLNPTDALFIWEKEVSNLILNDSLVIKTVPSTEVCSPDGKYRALLSPPLNFIVAEAICHILGGKLEVIGNASNTTTNESGKLLALTDEEVVIELNERKVFTLNHEQSKWTQASQMMNKEKNHSKKVQLPPLSQRKINKPSVKTSTKPLKRKVRQISESEEPQLNNESLGPELEFVATCVFDKPPVFRASGFCPDLLDLLDEKYVVQSHLEDRPIFQGFTGKKITYARGIWIAQSSLSPNIELWFYETLYDPYISPMGRHLWLLLITVDESSMDQEMTLPCDTEDLFLNLSPCESGYFTCSDGQCLPHQVRCDRKADCLDNSDEEYCAKVYVPSLRRSDLPPPPINGENFTEVFIKISVLDTEINFNVMRMWADVELTWKDPSVTIYNLDVDPLANIVDEETIQELWVPKIEFGHTNVPDNLFKNTTEVKILKQSIGQFEGYEFSWEASSFSGSENSFQIKERVYMDARCGFNSFLYPFGEQRCSFQFQLLSTKPNVIKLSTLGIYGGINWNKAKQELTYDFSNTEFMAKEDQMHSTNELIFKIYPRLGLIFINLFVPSFLLTMVALSSLYFGITHLQLRIGTSLIALVTLTAVEIQLSSSINYHQSDVKASDIWLFGCFVVIVAINLSHVVIIKDLHAKEEQATNNNRIVPVGMMTGQPGYQQDPQSYSSLVENANRLSNRMRKIFLSLTIFLVILYIIVFASMAATYR